MLLLVGWVRRSRLVVSGLLIVVGVFLCLAGEVGAHSGAELTVATLLLTAGTIMMAVGLAVLVAMLIFWAFLRVAKRLAIRLVSRSLATARRVAIVLMVSALIMAVVLSLLLLTWRFTGVPSPLTELLRILPTALPKREIPWLTIYMFINILTATLLVIPMVLPIILTLMTGVTTLMMIARRTATTSHRATPVA
jgi:hypothetical protein